uniref:Uncharacterized protein n=2 Tax=Amorphochlora amoebiformis TaxID=1561963 RepID=A0A7S0DSA8_9EUKA|mmetsp:Transcript_8151/g.12678  ORF Transcript_8151/g.12678 Transcript_8151/m.12678 type:complete len:121 (+) Transcript_8151:151-513(+)
MLKKMKQFRDLYSQPFLAPISFTSRDPSVRKFADFLDYVDDKLQQNGPNRALDLDMDTVQKYINAWEDSSDLAVKEFLEVFKSTSGIKTGSFGESIRNNKIRDTFLGKLLIGLGLDPSKL